MLTLTTGLVVGLVVVYFATIAFYRLTFHPLAKYPGPRLWAITQWPEALSNMSGNRHLDLHRAHERYGDVVRISPNSLSFRTAGAARDIYADRKANVVKTGWTDASLEINPNVNTHTLNDRGLHARRRRLLQHAFSESALRGLEVFVLDRVRAFCGYMGQPKPVSAVAAAGECEEEDKKDSWGKQQDMAKWTNNLTLDVLGELCFGKSFETMEAGGSMVSELLLSSSKINLVLAFLPIRQWIYPIFRQTWLIALIGGKTIQQKIQFRTMMLSLLHKRFALEEETRHKPDSDKRRDFMHYLINAHDPETGSKFTQKDLVGEAALLVGAGSDTSSTALSGLFYYLTLPRNAPILEKLQEEIRSNFTNIEEIKTGPKLSSLSYLRACIDEGLRITPPVSGILSRRILPGGATIDGHHLPCGTVVGVPIYALHHNKTYFPQPYTFKPERWITPDTSISDITTQRTAYMPFSLGPRNCIGKNMALMEINIVLARILFLYDIRGIPNSTLGKDKESLEKKGKVEWEEEEEEEYQIQDWLIADRKGPLVEFKKR